MPSFTKTFHSKPYPAISPSRPELKAGGKNVLITGAGSGIARAAAIAFAEAGASAVVLCGRRVQPLTETKQQIEADHPQTRVIAHVLDVSNEESVAKLFNEVPSQIGPIDIVVNGAGHLSQAADVKHSTLANFWDSFEVQVKGTFLMAQHWLRNPGENDPTFLSFNSLLAHMPASQITVCPASYASSKCAQAKLVEWIAKENAGRARFYSLHPGIVQTDMSMRSIEMIGNPEELKAKLPWDDGETSFPFNIGRRTNEILVRLPAHFSVWLASPEGASIPTGRYLWINWDADELKAEAHNIADDPYSLTLTLSQYPFKEAETTDVDTKLDLS